MTNVAQFDHLFGGTFDGDAHSFQVAAVSDAVQRLCNLRFS
jgi:hypothetical protein